MIAKGRCPKRGLRINSSTPPTPRHHERDDVGRYADDNERTPDRNRTVVRNVTKGKRTTNVRTVRTVR